MDQTMLPFSDLVPLSSSQQRIWFMQQFAGESVLYNVPVRLELSGPLDEVALRVALAGVWAGHETLRTTYRTESGMPRGEVRAPDTLPPVPMVDLSAEPDVGAALDRLADRQAAVPFRLESDLPVRLAIVRCGPRRVVLVGTFHHVAVDWVSLQLLARDLGARYTAHLTGGDAPAPPPGPAYREVAHWESGPEGSATIDRAVARRRAALADVAPLALPTDRPRPRFTRFAGGAVHGSLELSAVAAVRRLALRRRVTPFAVLMTAFVMVVDRAARQPEIIIGTPASGRVRAEWQEMTGCLVNVIPVVVRPDAAATGAELVTHVSEATWEALDAQDAPFDRLVRALGRRSVPLVNVLFSYQPNPPSVAFAGLADTAPEVFSPPGTAKYDLSLYVIGRGAGLRLEVEFDTDVYAPETATAVLRAYQETLLSLVRDPDDPWDRSAPSGFEAAARRTRERAADLDRPALERAAS